LHDHAALSAATAHHERVAVVFVFDAMILDALEDRDDKRVTFIYESLAEIDAVLRARRSRLIVLHGDPVELIPRLAQELRVGAVYANHDDALRHRARSARRAGPAITRSIAQYLQRSCDL